MRRIVAAMMTTAVCVVVMAVPGGAAPDNKNFGEIQVSCENGTTVVVVHNTNESALAFDEAGRPLVVQSFTGEEDSSFQILDEEEVVLDQGTVDATFTETHGRRKGIEGRTMTCTFTEQFSDEFEITQDDADYLDDVATAPQNADSYAEYVGETLVVAGTFTGTVVVTTPGR